MLTSIEEEEQLLEGLPGQPPRKEEEERNNNAANKKKEQYQNSCLHVFCSTLATVCLFLVIFTMDDESKRNNGLDLNDIGSRFHDLAVSNDTVAVAPRPTFRGQSADIMADIMEKANSSSDSEADATDMGKPDKLPLRLAEVEADKNADSSSEFVQTATPSSFLQLKEVVTTPAHHKVVHRQSFKKFHTTPRRVSSKALPLDITTSKASLETSPDDSVVPSSFAEMLVDESASQITAQTDPAQPQAPVQQQQPAAAGTQQQSFSLQSNFVANSAPAPAPTATQPNGKVIPSIATKYLDPTQGQQPPQGQFAQGQSAVPQQYQAAPFAAPPQGQPYGAPPPPYGYPPQPYGYGYGPPHPPPPGYMPVYGQPMPPRGQNVPSAYAAGPYSQQAMTPYQPYNLMQQVDPRMAQTQFAQQQFGAQPQQYPGFQQQSPAGQGFTPRAHEPYVPMAKRKDQFGMSKLQNMAQNLIPGVGGGKSYDNIGMSGAFR